MRQFLQIITLFLFIPLIVECSNYHNSKSKKMYYDAFQNNSTSPNYVVFKAIDLQTNLSKEICCESDNLFRAFIEDNISDTDTLTFKITYYKTLELYDSISNSPSFDYSFSFKSTQSLKNIGYYDYFSDSVDYYLKNTGTIINSIKKNYDPDKRLLLKDYAKNDNLYLIHVLFKNGIFCWRDCITGSISIRKILK
jgi:hypothetical protein